MKGTYDRRRRNWCPICTCSASTHAAQPTRCLEHNLSHHKYTACSFITLHDQNNQILLSSVIVRIHLCSLAASLVTSDPYPHNYILLELPLIHSPICRRHSQTFLAYTALFISSYADRFSPHLHTHGSSPFHLGQ